MAPKALDQVGDHGRGGLVCVSLALVLGPEGEADLGDAPMLVESHIEVADEFTLEFDPDLTRLPGDDVDPTRLVSDVPLGAFLSGGVDSSAVVAMMSLEGAAPVRTFSIGFTEADYDEVRFARMVAERYGTEHTELVVEPRALEVLPKLVRHYGEPFGDPSAVPTFTLRDLHSATYGG